MAYSVSMKTGGRFNIGNKRVRLCDVTFTGSYAAGGETLTPSDFGLKRIITVTGLVTEAAGKTAALPCVWNESTGKLQMYEAAAAGSPGAEKGAEAYAASTVGTLQLIGT